MRKLDFFIIQNRITFSARQKKKFFSFFIMHVIFVLGKS